MPSNKNRDKKRQAELTGKGDVIFKTVGIAPVLEKGEVVYKIFEIEFTTSKQCVSMVEVDSTKMQGTALNKLQLAVNRTLFDITELRKAAKHLKKENE
jgi:hypothetical protein